MTVSSADYLTVVEAARRCLRHGTPMTQAELVLAIDVVQHASLWLNSAVDRLEAIDALCDLTDAAADLAEAVSLNTDTKDYIATCLADQPDVAIIAANTVLDGD